MNNKAFKIIFLIVTFSIFTFDVKAECKDDELNNWAENVSIEFKEEVETKDYKPEFAYVLLMKPYNEKVTMQATDSYSEDFYNIDYDDYYKTNAIGSYVHFEEKSYTIRFYGNDKSSCKGELLREIEYKVPSYNQYSLTDFCQQDENKNQDICKMNTDTSKVTEKEFSEKADVIEKKNTKDNIFIKVLKYIGKYWYYAVIPFAVVAGIYYYKVSAYKKEQDKK